MSYAGTILSVDLTDRQIEKIPLTDELKRAFLGGQSLNAKLAYDLIKPGIDPLSPDNVMVFGAGVFGGTMLPTAGRTAAIAKSPYNNVISISNSGGMGPMMKFAGYDHLIVKGRANVPVYLKITDDDVEIIDAKHLWGKGIRDAVDALWEEIGEQYWVSAIGPAGENMVRYATIMNNKWHAFGRTGLGAVMGSKNLKAIAIYGTRGIKVHDKKRFLKIVDDTLETIFKQPDTGMWRSGGTHEWSLTGTEDMPPLIQPTPHVKALHEKTLLDINAYFDFYKTMPAPCYTCPVGCRFWLESKKGDNKGHAFGMSCSGGAMIGPYGFGIDIPRFDQVGILAEMGQFYGISAHNVGGVLGFVLESYEKGLVTKDVLDGLELTWGNFDTIKELLRRITYREGCGDVLADGIHTACKVWGIPDIYPIDFMNPRMMGGGMSVPPKARAESLLSAMTYDRYRFPREYYGTVGKEGIMRYARDAGASEGEAAMTVDCEEYDVAMLAKLVIPLNILVQTFGTCDSHYFVHKTFTLQRFIDVYSAATGIDLTLEDLKNAGYRGFYMHRAFVMREGHTKEDDLSRVSKDRGESEKLVNRFYELEGWDSDTGKPTMERLKELGLEYIADDLGV